ncbi:response regulator transcription factor [candidate division KSB1 bacterium]|nr:response regulator transcription factor [candidate division KSB1 bacterium]NIR72569.1 response regulator transcription factor [candidate division KSB1 bacterium]NIS27321.1 response regulator transcription factor [candidate division KSB1 bacterium]NIT73531.1 response regulator transcription factor [candidate division KSB1 bacterium]NIU28051.1 response regulator transcription factor [candidate division KSB1 bacterium]
MKLLLVEDNPHLADEMDAFLKESGFVVERAATFDEASERIAVYQYDLVIVDLGLPDGSGLDLITEIKQKETDTGILILTARDAIEDKVSGLDLGADDYMTKPFHKSELNARIRSILRRHKFNRSNIIQLAEIKIDLLASQAFVNEVPLSLTKKEYDLLLYFMQNSTRLLTKESIAEHLWGDHIDQANSFDFIYNHIKNLRKKIIAAGGKNRIQAMYGMGYKFTPDQ